MEKIDKYQDDKRDVIVQQLLDRVAALEEQVAKPAVAPSAPPAQ